MNNLDKICVYFDGKFEKFGRTPLGVDWNSSLSQKIRFEQVLKIINPNMDIFNINDIGCGYGQLTELLDNNRILKYTGYDLSEKMISAAKKEYASSEKFNFIKINDFNEIEIADYSVASGIYNMKLDATDSEWTNYVVESLKLIFQKSKFGFSFNMLTSYSDIIKKRDDLYYGDPCFYFDYCKRNFSKNIALLHDYGLYDFTILVTKD